MDGSINKKSARIPEDSWETYRSKIQRLYIDEHRNLEGEDGVIQLMQQDGFFASKSQYETRFKKWQLRKNASKDQWLALSRQHHARETQGKSSRVMLYGRNVSNRKLKKQRSRYRNSVGCEELSNASMSSPPLPQDMTITTPSPQPFSPASAHRVDGIFDAHMPRAIVLKLGNIKFSHPTRQCRGFTLENRLATCRSPILITQTTQAFIPATRELQIESSALDNSGHSSASDILLQPLFSSSRPQFPLALDLSKSIVSDFPIRVFVTPEQEVSLQTHTPNMSILHLSLYILLNNLDPCGRLRWQIDPLNQKFRQVVEWLLSQRRPNLRRYLNGIPDYLKPVLEERLLWCAVWVGATSAIAELLPGVESLPSKMKIAGYQSLLREAFDFEDQNVSRMLIVREILMLQEKSNMSYSENGSISEDIPPEKVEEIIIQYLSNGNSSTPEILEFCLMYCGPEMFEQSVDSLRDSILDQFVDGEALQYLLEDTSHMNKKLKAIARSLHDLARNLTLHHSKQKEIESCLENIVGAVLSIDDDYRSLSWNSDECDVEDIIRVCGSIDNENIVCAIYEGQHAALKVFLELGANPNTVFQLYDDEHPRTALSDAIYLRRDEIVDTMEREGYLASVAAFGDGDKVAFELALTAAINSGNKRIVDVLLYNWRICQSPLSVQSVIPALGFDINNFGQIDTEDDLSTIDKDITQMLLRAGVAPSTLLLKSVIANHDSELAFQLINHLDATSIALALSWKTIKHGSADLIGALVSANQRLGLLNRGFEADNHHHWPASILWEGDIRIRGNALSFAILLRDAEIIDLLLAAGIAIDRVESAGRCNQVDGDQPFYSPLAAAAQVRNLLLVNDLISRGVNVKDGYAIYLATISGMEFLCPILHALSRTHNIPAPYDPFGYLAFEYVIEKGDATTLRLLAQHLDVNYLSVWKLDSSDWQKSPLQCAVSSRSSGAQDMVKILCDAGADVNRILFAHKNFDGATRRTTALHKAIEMANISLIQELLDQGGNVNLPASFGLQRTPLQQAVEVGNKDLVEYLLNQGAEVNAPAAEERGATALQLAAINGFAGIVALLLQNNADVNAPAAPIEGRTAFEGATEHGRIEMMIYLVQNGADLLANEGEQYYNGIEFAEDNGQYGAIALAKHLYEEALKRAAEAPSPTFPSSNPHDSVFDSQAVGEWHGEFATSLHDMLEHDWEGGFGF